MAPSLADPTPPPKAAPAPDSRPPMPRWVKIFGIIGLAVLVLIAVVVAANKAGLGGDHGPGRHLPSGGDSTHGAHPSGSHTPPATHHASDAATAPFASDAT